MRFLDEARIRVTAGSGGNGCVAFLREKYRPRGGPSGGDGGRGGDVIGQADEGMGTLLYYSSHRLFLAQSGENGRGKTQHGRSGEDLVLKLPTGTIIKDALASSVAAALVSTASTTASDPDTYYAYASAFVLVTALVFLAAGVARLGFITQFLSKPVMDGFVMGLALFVAVGQLNKLFGVPKPEGNTVQRFFGIIQELPQANWVTFAVGAAALALLFLLPRWNKRIPAGLVVLFGSIIVSWALNLNGNYGVEVVGTLPQGLPSFSVPQVPLLSYLAMILPRWKKCAPCQPSRSSRPASTALDTGEESAFVMAAFPRWWKTCETPCAARNVEDAWPRSKGGKRSAQVTSPANRRLACFARLAYS